MYTKVVTLVEILEHLKQLSDLEMKNSVAFSQTSDEYTHVLLRDCPDRSEIRDAIEYLKKIEHEGIQGLNLDNMIEELEERI